MPKHVHTAACGHSWTSDDEPLPFSCPVCFAAHRALFNDRQWDEWMEHQDVEQERREYAGGFGRDQAADWKRGTILEVHDPRREDCVSRDPVDVREPHQIERAERDWDGASEAEQRMQRTR